MDKVSNFIQVRADGKLVPSTMTVSEVRSLGWPPSKVIALRWTSDGKSVEIAAQQGVHGTVVPGENFVAAIISDDKSDASGRLIVFSSSGQRHGELANRVTFAGRELDGYYSWFEPALFSHVNVFGAVFRTRGEGVVRCDIDAVALRVTNAISAR